MSDELADFIQQIRSYQNFTKLLHVSEFGTGRIVPFVPNSVQKRLMNRIITADREKRPARLIILKARQFGVSTLLQSVFIHRAITRRGFKAITVAHQAKNAGDLFEIGANFYLRLPEQLKEAVYQKHQRRSSRILLSNDSDLEVETANDLAAGRGSHAQAMHMSEVGFWSADAAHAALSLRQTIQNLPGTLVAMESTANGQGGFYHEEWLRAVEGLSDYEAIFEPWFAYEHNVTPTLEYHYDGQGNFKFESDEEEILKDRHSLSSEQMLWWRKKLNNECGGDLDKMRQEYPSDSNSAFTTSGRLYFTAALVNRWDPKLPILVGDIEKKPVKQDQGPLWLYHDVEEGRKYIASVDPAGIQGDHHVGTAAQEDWSCIWVVRRHDMQTVAVWRDKVDPDVLAAKAAALGRYFNKAILAPEMNGEGAVVLFKLKDEIRYPKIYRRVVLDTRGEPETEKEGWRTTSTNRPAILAGLREILRDDPHKLSDIRLQNEMGTFIIANAKPQAKAGSHDDLVMAAAIAIQVASEHPQVLRLDEFGKPIIRPRQQYEGKRSYEDGPATKNGMSADFNRRHPK